MTFMIWSQRHEAWWKPEGAGYTKKKSEAGLFTIQEALRQNLDGVSGDIPRSADMLVCNRD